MQNNDNQKTYFIYVRSTGEKVLVTKEQHDSFYILPLSRTAASTALQSLRPMTASLPLLLRSLRQRP